MEFLTTEELRLKTQYWRWLQGVQGAAWKWLWKHILQGNVEGKPLSLAG